MSTKSYQKTPVDELRHEYDSKGGDVVLVSEWCDHHDVLMCLMPFDYRSFDPLEAAKRINSHIESLHNLSQTFMSKDVGVSNLAGAEILNPLFRLYSVTQMDQTSKGLRYYNPKYEHYDACITEIRDMEKRQQFYEQFRHNPFLGGDWYGKHWGITHKTALNTISDFGYSLREDRLTARKRLGRTLHTINQWRDDYNQKALVELMPANYNTVRDYIKRFAINAEWKPPERPSGKSWFRGKNPTDE